MRKEIIVFLLVMAMAPGLVAAGTLSFNDFGFTDSEIKIYFVNGSGTVLNDTIMSNQTTSINSTNDYIITIAPANIDIMNNPQTLNVYVRAIIGLLIAFAAFGAFVVLLFKVAKQGSS